MSLIFLPIFPLPDIVLFPHTLLPLHVFEARYRAMVADCLARDRRLAVVGLRPGYEASYHGKPPVFGVAGAGEIVRWARLPTGRFDILVRGDGRIRIQRDMPADTLYRMVAATPLEERAGDGPGAAALAASLRSRCRKLLEAAGRPAPEMERILAPATPPGVLCDRVAAALLPGPADRQALLEELDVECRLRRLAELLDEIPRGAGGDR